MKRLLLVAVLLVAVCTLTSVGQTVKVTFVANTATVPDTLKPNSTVQVRGSAAPLSWDGATGVTLLNVGGDYWSGFGNFKTGDTVQYKFYTNAVDAVGSREHQGWEQNTTDPSTNRILIVGAKDTTLPLQFVNGSATNQPQYWTPYAASDSIDMWFRVNMQGKEDFNPAQWVMGLRGSNNKDWGATGDLNWGKTTFLTMEKPHGNGGSRQYNADNFWSGRVRVPTGKWIRGRSWKFKFVIMKKGTRTAPIRSPGETSR